jgi:hypothetical protein
MKNGRNPLTVIYLPVIDGNYRYAVTLIRGHHNGGLMVKNKITVKGVK